MNKLFWKLGGSARDATAGGESRSSILRGGPRLVTLAFLILMIWQCGVGKAAEPFSMIFTSDPQFNWWRQELDPNCTSCGFGTPQLDNDFKKSIYAAQDPVSIETHYTEFDVHLEANAFASNDDMVNSMKALKTGQSRLAWPSIPGITIGRGAQALQPTHLVINGDLTAYWHPQQYHDFKRKFFDPLSVVFNSRVFPGLGNHDYENNTDDGTYGLDYIGDKNRNAKEAVYWMANFIADNSEKLQSYDLPRYVSLKNEGGFVVRLKVYYTMPGGVINGTQMPGLELHSFSDYFELGQRRGVSIPPGAYDIHYSFEIKAGKTIRVDSFKNTLRDCWTVSGTTQNPSWNRSGCPNDWPDGSGGSLSYSYNVGNYHFVQLHNYPGYEVNLPRKTGVVKPNTDYGIGYSPGFAVLKSYHWLQQDLARATAAGKYSVINVHDSGSTLGSLDSSDSEKQEQYKSFRNAITNQSVVAIFAGHLHEKYGKYETVENGPHSIPVFLSGSSECRRFLLAEFHDTYFNVGVVNASQGKPVFVTNPSDVCDNRVAYEFKQDGDGDAIDCEQNLGNIWRYNDPQKAVPTPVTVVIPKDILQSVAWLETENPTEGQELQFRSALPAGVNQTGISYIWRFSDGQESHEPTPKHTFATGGHHRATFTALRGSPYFFQIHLVDFDVNRKPLSPVAFFGPAQASHPVQGAEYDFRAFAFDTDPLQMQWDFGDDASPGIGSSVKHIYTEAGPKTATVTISDNRGGIVQVKRSFVIYPVSYMADNFAALSLNGSAEVAVPHSPGLNAVKAIGAWIRTTQSVGRHGIVNKHTAGSSNGFGLYTMDGRIGAFFGNERGKLFPDLDGGAIADGAWHHVAVAVRSVGVDEGEAAIYVDGFQRDFKPWFGTFTGSSTTVGLLLGSYPGIVDGRFVGEMAEVSLWNQELSRFQIESLLSPLQGNEAGLIAYFKLGETLGNSAENSAFLREVSPGALTSAVGSTPRLNYIRGFVNRELYMNPAVDGTLQSLERSPGFPDAPDISELTQNFELNDQDFRDHYGARMRGYFIPLQTGKHIFYLAADDNAVLYLSSDADPVNKVVIAREPDWADRRDWTSDAGGRRPNHENISAPVQLQAGTAYYVEARVAEGVGGDHLAVAVQQPGSPYPPSNGSPPIDASMLAYSKEFLIHSASISRTGPFTGAPSSLRLRIEAEDFDRGGEGLAYHDANIVNEGGLYRPTEGVDIESTSDIGGGFNVGWTAQGEWLNYQVSVPDDGLYTFQARVASAIGGGTFHVEFDNVDKTGPITFGDTGGWQSWKTIEKLGLSLKSGTQTMKVVWDSNGGGNLNYYQFSLMVPPGPLGGLMRSITSRIEAEDFDEGGEGVAYHDAGALNEGNAYRPSEGVDIEATTDVGGGFDIGYTARGEWTRYTVTVDADGLYDFEARVASGMGGATIHVEVDGVDKSGPITFGDTGGWQSWTTVRKEGLSLNAGTHLLKVVWDSDGGGNLNYFQFVLPSAVAPSLRAIRSGNSLVLEWSPAEAVLETALTLTSNWVVVPGAVSSYTNELAGPERYFRLAPPSVSGSALGFSGAQDYVAISSAGALQAPFTIELWAMTTDPTGEKSLMGSRSPGEASFDFKLNNGNEIHGDIGDGANWINTAADAPFAYSTGVWHHIAYVVTQTGYTVYTNGVVAGSGPLSGGAPLLYDATHQLCIGSAGGAFECWSGQIDEARLWRVARTASQIQETMRSGAITGAEIGLEGYWRFDEGSGTTVNDLSGHGHTGTLMGSPQWLHSGAP